MKIVFFGTPEFSAAVLSSLVAGGHKVVAVVSRPDRPKGRNRQLQPTPVKETAAALHLPIYQPETSSDPLFMEALRTCDADLFVVAAYGEILRQAILDMPKRGCINLHTSLLPRWRGAAPIQQAIIHGDRVSGVSIMHMVRKMDAGAVIASSRVAIPDEMTFGELEAALLEVGCPLLDEVILRLEGEALPGVPQNESEVTLAPKIELEDCRIDWHRPARDLHNLVRGVSPYPTAWCQVSIKGAVKRLKVLRTEVVADAAAAGLVVACGDGALRLLEVQLEGKRAMSADELMRGIQEIIFLDE